jgi:hypothetical protein
MRGDALDFSGSRHTATQRSTIAAAGRKLGAKVLEETYPVHVHMEDLSKVARVVTTGAKVGMSAWAISVSVGAALLGLVALRNWARKRRA